ncbi:MAG: hypothetical protein ACRECT_06525 [Thermoplasmata archaeon]
MTDDDETILEYVLRELLSKERIVELSASLGGPRQGSKVDLAEKVLGIRGLKVADAIADLSLDDLRLIVRRFDVPEPSKPATPGQLLGSFFGDEKASLKKRIEVAASKQRSPKQKIVAAGTTLSATQYERSPPSSESRDRPPDAKSVPALTTSEGTPIASPPLSTGSKGLDSPSPPKAHASPAPALVGGNDASQFDELCRFLDGYNFTKRWDSEDLYEAELGGAISGHFRGQKVVHQMAVGGTKADIVALGAVIEIKYPKTRQPLQTLVGQVEDYQRLFANRVVVVLCSGGLRETQAFNDSAATLSDRGVKVYIK